MKKPSRCVQRPLTDTGIRTGPPTTGAVLRRAHLRTTVVLRWAFFVDLLSHKETNMNERLQEFVDSRGLPIQADRERGIIRGVKILGVHSRNGRNYLPDAIDQAVSLYEGAKVNVNHAKGAPSGPRDYQDRIGVIRNVTARADEGLFGDFHFNPKHTLAEQLLWDAEHAPQNVGFSHNVQARTARRGDTIVVEAITKVQSVDLVADPATTHGLFESARNDDKTAEEVDRNDTQLLKSLTADRLKQTRPDLIEELLAEPKKRINQLQEDVQQLRSAESARRKRETVQTLLAEYEISGKRATEGWQRHLVSESFVESLMRADDEPTMRQLIQERVQLVRDIAGGSNGRPLSREQTHLYTQQPDSVKAFVRCIS